MNEVATPTPETTLRDRCTRCLQPVPAKARRCPGCGHPIQDRRYLTLLIGAAGVCALAFVMVVMYLAARRADLQNAPVPVDSSDTQQQPVLSDPPPDNGKPAEPAQPEKRPPLNEK